nr:hypothetical protein [Tanacetum cinerariifolium]
MELKLLPGARLCWEKVEVVKGSRVEVVGWPGEWSSGGKNAGGKIGLRHLPAYVPGPEYLPSPEFVLEPVYPEFMPAEDDILFTEEQPLPAAASPTTEFDPDEDPEDNPEEDPEEDPADYPADRGDEGDDKDESFDDDEDDDIEIEGDKEEDEYLAPVNSTAVSLPAIDHAPSAEETEPFETDESAATPPPHSAYRVTARMSIRP